MPIHIIIDGYNLIRQSSALSVLDDQDIQLGREALIDQLAKYKRLRGHQISVVFDGQNAPTTSTRRSRVKGIDIIFSLMGELADTVIKRMATGEKERALVVTSDQDIESYVSARGANVVSSPVFEEKLTMAGYMMLKGGEEDGSEGWIPTTQKKGPRRRLSKKARKNRAKIDKL
ncbi:MAG: NYN domain-containing protein [Thermodesulfobacteriota bacterium]|nr:NYN domain-containing protein [Thermodesulfobacteriota bacterium]